MVNRQCILKIQMGEKWKKMTDKEKKPYFEIARKYALEHKQVILELVVNFSACFSCF